MPKTRRRIKNRSLRTPHKRNSHKAGTNYYVKGFCGICCQQRDKMTKHHVNPRGYRTKGGCLIKMCFDCHAVLHACYRRAEVAEFRSKAEIRDAIGPYLAWAAKRHPDKRAYRDWARYELGVRTARTRKPGGIGIRHMMELGRNVNPEVVAATLDCPALLAHLVGVTPPCGASRA